MTSTLMQTEGSERPYPRRTSSVLNAGLISYQVLVEPGHSLEEGLLLGEGLVPLGQVAADGKAVLDTRVQGDLVGQAGLLEDLLRLVALLGGEDGVGLGGGYGQGAGDSGELVLVDEGGVGKVADVNAVLEVTSDVLEGKERQRVSTQLMP